MNSKNYLKRIMPSLSSVALCLSGFALAPLARAVVPAPDGGYPGFNTAEGQNALLNLTTGIGNTAVGWFSLWSNTDGSYNTAVGAGTLLFNIGNQSTGDGIQNTAIGAAALLNNTTGSATRPLERWPFSATPKAIENTAIGDSALFSNTTGLTNTAVGIVRSLQQRRPFASRTDYSCACGAFALFANSTGHSTRHSVRARWKQHCRRRQHGHWYCVALNSNTTGNFNTANGRDARSQFNTTGDNNTANGAAALT